MTQHPWWCLTTLALATSAWAAPDAGPPPAQSPFPTDAECLALGSMQQPMTFGTGEELEFDLDALGAKAGKMTMRVLPQREGTLPIEIHAETNTFFSKIRRVNGTATSYLNPKTLRPTRYYENTKENEHHKVADVTFNKDKTLTLVSTINGHTAQHQLRSTAKDLSDVAGAVYMMRQLEMKEGLKVCFDVYGIRAIWRVWGAVGPKEPASLPLGQFTAWHLAGEAARVDLPHMRRQVHVWLTDDARRLPLAALGSIDLGAVRATLVGFSRPGDARAKAENKGNLKW